MTNVLDGIITVIVGIIDTAAKIPSVIAEGWNNVNDFIYVRYYGLPFIVLGARQTGKTTLIRWLRSGQKGIEGFEPSPTASGGDAVPKFSTQVADETIRTQISRDVGGEYAMWETDWVELFRQTRPAGVIFMLDHEDSRVHKEALNFVLQMIDEDESVRKNLKAFLILVNKADLWSANTNLEKILKNYPNEMRRAKLISARLSLWHEVHSCSLLEGFGITSAMQGFINAIRPKPRKIIPVSFD